MGIVHHSNYIRWFEEARIAFLDAVGLPYKLMEEKGVLIPVLGVSCTYKSPVRFGETLDLTLTMREYSGFRFKVAYQGINSETGQVSVIGESKHCFTTKEMRPVRLKNTFPEWHERFLKMMEDDKPTA